MGLLPCQRRLAARPAASPRRSVAQGQKHRPDHAAGPLADAARFRAARHRAAVVRRERRLQDASAEPMAFPLDELIAELSLGMTLRAGDILLTGTPAGVGNARTPPKFLTDGDEVVVGATGL
ncbi:fumarylacetoacetate hydrolase family protein [Cupriavidus necator]